MNVASFASALSQSPFFLVRQHRQQQQRHDVGDLDHRVHRGPGGVLVGIADRVAGHRRLVGLGALAAVMAVLDVFLGVVPGAAARGHRDRDEQRPVTITPSSMAPTAEKAADLPAAAAGDEVDHEVHHDRRQHRQQRRDDHLLDRGLGQQVHGAAVVRLAGALHDARVLAELAADLLDDRAGGAADRGHAHGAEQVGQQAAEQQADHDVGVGEREIERNAAKYLCCAALAMKYLRSSL